MSAKRAACHDLRVMTLSDLPQVTQIEHLTSPYPWQQKVFTDCLFVGYECWILTCPDVIGFGILSLGAREAHILNIAVHPNWQGLGYGKKIITHLLHVANPYATDAILEVRKSNHVALNLYTQLGFQIIGERIKYYQSPVSCEDALTMKKVLS